MIRERKEMLSGIKILEFFVSDHLKTQKCPNDFVQGCRSVGVMYLDGQVLKCTK